MSDGPTAFDECPDAEALAAYVDGGLDPAARGQVEAHFADCSDCREILADTSGFLLGVDRKVAVPDAPDRQEPSAQRVLALRPRWAGIAVMLAAAAAVLVVARIEPRWLPWSVEMGSPDMAELVTALGNQPTRVMDGRLSGGFRHGPPPTVTRGLSGRQVSPDVQIAAAHIELAASGESASQQGARGIASLVTGDVDRAITELEGAVRKSPADANHLNDLSAAYLARAGQADRPDDWRLALQTADRALAGTPSMPEALFNRAVALDGLGLTDQARSAWQAYLQVDRTSPWGLEAKSRCGC